MTTLDSALTSDDAVRRPTLGDHVTLYTAAEAGPWLKLSPSTLRRLRAQGEIPSEYFTEVGGRPGRPARLCMTGHQIAALIGWWTSRTAPSSTPDPVRRRRGAA